MLNECCSLRQWGLFKGLVAGSCSLTKLQRQFSKVLHHYHQPHLRIYSTPITTSLIYQTRYRQLSAAKKMVDVGYFPLSNGVKLPRLGLGTWLVSSPLLTPQPPPSPAPTLYTSPIQAKDAEELKSALRAAFDVGYRYIDTAPIYENETVIGEVLQEYISEGKFKREDVFITSKVGWVGTSSPEQTPISVSSYPSTATGTRSIT